MDFAGLGKPLEPRHDVDSVIVDVFAHNDSIADIDADPVLDLTVLGDLAFRSPITC